MADEKVVKGGEVKFVDTGIRPNVSLQTIKDKALEVLLQYQ